MALALFALGTVVLVVGAPGRNSGMYLLRSGGSAGDCGFFAAAGFFRSKDILGRLPGLGNGTSTPDFRIALWHDTVNLATGAAGGGGLGAVRASFIRNTVITRAHTSRCAIRTAIGCGCWGKRARGRGWRRRWWRWARWRRFFPAGAGKNCGPYRQMAAVCAVMFLLHSMVDVPAHRWGHVDAGGVAGRPGRA